MEKDIRTMSMIERFKYLNEQKTKKFNYKSSDKIKDNNGQK